MLDHMILTVTQIMHRTRPRLRPQMEFRPSSFLRFHVLMLR
jgi:hypothetical protein